MCVPVLFSFDTWVTVFPPVCGKSASASRGLCARRARDYSILYIRALFFLSHDDDTVTRALYKRRDRKNENPLSLSRKVEGLRLYFQCVTKDSASAPAH